MVPVAAVKIWASSALLRARPVPEVAPTLMGWSGWAVRTTTPPAAGVGANTLTVLFPLLATKRLPPASKARALGPSARRGWRWGWCCPARTRSPCAGVARARVGHEEVAAGVEGQGAGTVQPGEGGFGGGARRQQVAVPVVDQGRTRSPCWH